MGVYSAEGRFGSGKTAFCVWFAAELARRRGGVPLWCNFNVVGGQTIHTFEDLYRCEGGVILLDELQNTIHARRSNYNLVFLEWFDQCRKQDSDVIIITQALHKVDVIVREMIELDFDCEDKGDGYSRITPYDLHTGKKKTAFTFDRRVSYDRYNTRERAWALKPAAELEPTPIQQKRTIRKGAAMGP